MVENSRPKCSNGHEQPQAGSKFCIYCGTALVVGQARPDQKPFPGSQPFDQPLANQPAQQYQQVPPQQDQPVNPLPPGNGQEQFPQYQNQPNYQNYQPNQQQFPIQQYVPQTFCGTCGGNASNLPEKIVICRECRSLKPLVPGYQVDNSAFAWAADAKAMAALRAAKPLSLAAKAVSEKVGRRWIEVAFNGILLSERQMPHIYGQAVRAARILGMPHMPDVYISGERPWDCLTFGTDKDSFIVIGSAVAGNFQGVDMLFLLAREMGHCKSGHALWKTVIRFFLGEQGPAKGFMAGGIFNALSPTAIIGGAIEMPLLAWARQAEITADRAGLLAVGSEEVARRVLLSWSLKSSFLFKQVNIKDWLEQEAVEDDSYLKLSELTTSSTPYLGPRLRLLRDFARSPELQHSLRMISEIIKQSAPPPPRKSEPGVVRFKCSTCGAAMKIPQKALEGKNELPVKCPDAKCGAVTRLKKNAKAGQVAKTSKPSKQENLNYGE